MNAVFFSLAFALLALAVFAMLRPFDKRLVLSSGLLFAAYLGLDDLATSLQQVSPVFNWLDGRWNWKAGSTAWRWP